MGIGRESVGSSATDGVFFDISTSAKGPPGHQQIAWQEVNIRVYHRQNGKETWGWFDTHEKATPQSYTLRDDQSFTLFDGERLRIHFADYADLKPFDLDITFCLGRWFGQAHWLDPLKPMTWCLNVLVRMLPYRMFSSEIG